MRLRQAHWSLQPEGVGFSEQPPHQRGYQQRGRVALPFSGISSNLFAAGWTAEPASRSARQLRRGRRSDVSVVPPTPDDFSKLDGVLYGEPDPVTDTRWTAQGTRAVPLLRTASEELEDVLHQAGDSPAQADMGTGPCTNSRQGASRHPSSPMAARRLAEPWEVGSSDSLADVIAMDDAGAAAHHQVPQGDSVDELLREDALPDREPLYAKVAGSLSAPARSAAVQHEADPLAGVLDDMPAEGPEEALATRSARRGGAKPSGILEVLEKAGAQQTVDADEEEIDAALRRFARKRAAAPLDDVLAVDGAEVFPGGGSLPASPRQRRVRARAAALTKSVSSLRSLACGKAK